MSEQRQHPTINESLQNREQVGDDPAQSAARLAAARGELSSVFAAADAILDGLRLGNHEKFLEQVRQSGGQ